MPWQISIAMKCCCLLRFRSALRSVSFRKFTSTSQRDMSISVRRAPCWGSSKSSRTQTVGSFGYGRQETGRSGGGVGAGWIEIWRECYKRPAVFLYRMSRGLVGQATVECPADELEVIQFTFGKWNHRNIQLTFIPCAGREYIGAYHRARGCQTVFKLSSV